MSGDIMTFPKTIDEFMERYKITDTEHVYTNGAELIPIFRMKQWFEHVDAEPVRHGRWLYYNDKGVGTCSECGNWLEFCFAGKPDKFCSFCGAKMDDLVKVSEEELDKKRDEADNK